MTKKNAVRTPTPPMEFSGSVHAIEQEYSGLKHISYILVKMLKCFMKTVKKFSELYTSITNEIQLH